MSVLFSRFRECLSSQPTRSELKRAAILEAAVAEFQIQGFRDTSMDRIAEHANVSKRTVYNHFESKEVLFRAIVGEMLGEQADSIDIVYDSKRSLEEQLLELVNQDVELLRDDGFIGMARVLLAESFSTPDLARTAFGEAAQVEHPLARCINAAATDGQLVVEDPQLATMQLKSMLKGLLFWPLVIGYAKRPTKKQEKAIVTGAVRMFLDHYAK
jgi:TetR/AcrR family transcriptional regulator of autoinduction and epiphytic fitness